MKNFLLVLWLCIVPCGSPLWGADNGSHLPAWLGQTVLYQVYLASFQDSDGDGVGDIKGIISRLDYIRSLGCNTLWLNPCFHSAFRDGGYDILDYYQVAPRYGTNADLRSLFDEAHKRGMRVILDLVAGHTSNEHPWFRHSQKASGNPYSKRYIWTPDSTLCPPKYVKGTYERNGNYQKNYFDFQPALNYGYGDPDSSRPWEEPVEAEAPTATRRALMHIMDYWMDMGCDGFRIDMAGSLVKNDPRLVGTRRLWQEVRTHFRSLYPEGVLLAEWGHPDKAKQIGFMVDFLFQFGLSGYRDLFCNEEGVYRRDTCYFDKRGIGSAKRFVKNMNLSLEAMGDDAYLSVPTGNHDVQRLNCGPRSSVAELKVAMSFLLTLPGIPCLYYGDEIGMRYLPDLPDVEGSRVKSGNRAGSRTPMQWNEAQDAGFSTAHPDSFYLPLDPSARRPNVAAQEADSSSLLHTVRSLLSLRRHHPALASRGTITFLEGKDGNEYPLCFLRKSGEECVLVCVNPSGRTVRTSFGGVGGYRTGTVLWNCGELPSLKVSARRVSVALKPLSAVVYALSH